MNKYIELITPADYNLYQSFFAASGGDAVYPNSWTYITQACRGLGIGFGLKYLHRDALFSLGYHHGHYVVINPLGCLNDLPVLLRALERESRRPVFVKKVSLARASALPGLAVQTASSYHDRKPLPGAYVWDDIAFSDDDTYPEQIVDVDLALRQSAKFVEWLPMYRALRQSPAHSDLDSVRRSFRQFRRCVRSFAHSGHRCEIVEFHPAMLPEVSRFVTDYFAGTRPNASKAYCNLFAGLERGIRVGSQYCYVVTVGVRSIAGVIFAERLDSFSVGIYMRLIPRTIIGLPEYALTQALNRLRHEGIRRVNLGGSETLGLHIFKQKLAPVEERHLPLLVYTHRTANALTA